MKANSAKTTRRQPRPQPSASKFRDLRGLIQGVEKRLQAEIADLRGELRASETALAAARLRTLNERQVEQGVAQLQADLKALQDLGIVDADGRRVRQELPIEMFEGASDVV